MQTNAVANPFARISEPKRERERERRKERDPDLADALAGGLVATGVEAAVRVAVAGAADWVAPPAERTRLLLPPLAVQT